MRPSLLGAILSAAFIAFTGYVVINSMTCGEWYCGWLSILPAVPWIFIILPFASSIPPSINLTVGMIGIVINVILCYRIGARIGLRLKRRSTEQ